MKKYISTWLIAVTLLLCFVMMFNTGCSSVVTSDTSYTLAAQNTRVKALSLYVWKCEFVGISRDLCLTNAQELLESGDDRRILNAHYFFDGVQVEY
jgi:hypothetical protein